MIIDRRLYWILFAAFIVIVLDELMYHVWRDNNPGVKWSRLTKPYPLQTWPDQVGNEETNAPWRSRNENYIRVRD